MKKLAAFSILLFPLLLPAAEKVTWEELRHRLPANLDRHHITLVTRDGKVIRGRRLALQEDRAVIEANLVSRSDVERIEVRDRGIYRHHITEPATVGAQFIAFGCSEETGGVALATCPLGLAVGLPALAWAAVVTPPVAIADGIALLRPPQVYEMVGQ